jgi:O-antigen ligase
VWILISSALSISVQLSIFGALTLVIALLFFYIISTSSVSILSLITAFSVGVLWSGIAGLLQFYYQDVNASTFLGISIQSASNLGSSVVEYDGFRFLRTYGPVSHPNIFGGFLSLGVLSLLYVTLSSGRWLIRIPTLASIPLLIMVLITTVSRSALLGFVISTLIFFIIIFVKKISVSRKRLYKSLGVVLFSFIIFSLLLSPILLPRITGAGRLETMSNNERVSSIIKWPTVVSDSLFIGLGPNTYRYAIAKSDHEALPGYFYQPVHSTYLLIIGEIGIFGFLILLIFIGVSFRGLYIEIFKGEVFAIMLFAFFIVVVISSFFDHYWWSTHFGLLILFFIFGLLFRNFLQKS